MNSLKKVSLVCSDFGSYCRSGNLNRNIGVDRRGMNGKKVKHHSTNVDTWFIDRINRTPYEDLVVGVLLMYFTNPW